MLIQSPDGIPAHHSHTQLLGSQAYTLSEALRDTLESVISMSTEDGNILGTLLADHLQPFLHTPMHHAVHEIKGDIIPTPEGCSAEMIRAIQFCNIFCHAWLFNTIDGIQVNTI